MRKAGKVSDGFWESFRSSLADFRCRPLTALSSAASEAQALVVCTGFNFPASDRASCSSIFAEITCNRATSGARFWWPNVAQVHFSTFKTFKKSKSTCQQNGPSAKALRRVPQACWNPHTNISLFLCLYRIIQYIITLSSVLLLKLAVVDTLQISANMFFKHDNHKLTGTSSNIDISMSQRLSSKCLSKEGEWCCLWGNVSLYKQCISIQVADYDTLGRSWSDLIWRVRERLIRRRNSSMAQSTLDGREHNGCEDSTIFQARLPAESAKCCKRCVLVFLGLDGQGSIDWLRQYLVHQDCKIHDNTMKQATASRVKSKRSKSTHEWFMAVLTAWLHLWRAKILRSILMRSLNALKETFYAFQKAFLQSLPHRGAFVQNLTGLCTIVHLDHCVRNRVRKTEQSRES